VIIFALSLIFLIFVPGKNYFHNYKDFYPELGAVCESDGFKTLIMQEIDDADWTDHPDEDLWRKPESDSMSYQIIPILRDGQWRHAEKYAHLANLVTHVPHVRSIILAKIGGRTVLKPHCLPDNSMPSNSAPSDSAPSNSAPSHSTMRISTPLSVPSPNINKCGVWTKGDIRPLDSTVMYDAGKLHSVFNSRKAPAIVLLLDVDRPKKNS